MAKCKIISCLLHFKCLILSWSDWIDWLLFDLFCIEDKSLPKYTYAPSLPRLSSHSPVSFLFSLTPSSVLPTRWPSVMRTPRWCSWRKSFGRTRLWGENTTLRSSTLPWRPACGFHLSSGLLCCTETWSTSHICSPSLTRYQYDSYACH